MLNFIKFISAEHLLNTLATSGLLASSERERAEDFIILRNSIDKPPLYLNLLMAIGAILSMAFFGACLESSKLIDFKSAFDLIVTGLIFVLGACIFSRLFLNIKGLILESFLSQLLVCMMILGKFLFVWGCSRLFLLNFNWAITFAILIVSIPTYFIYQVSIDRFLSSLAFFFSFAYSIVNYHWSLEIKHFAVHFFYSFCIVLALAIFSRARCTKALLPLAYSSLLTLMVLVPFIELFTNFQIDTHRPFEFNFLRLVLSLSLIYIIAWAAGGFSKIKQKSFIPAVIGSMFLAFVSAPAIILGLCIMLIGFIRQEEFLAIIGAIFLSVFIFLYYSNLELTLITKSGVLIASGAVLLLGRFYYFIFHSGTESVS